MLRSRVRSISFIALCMVLVLSACAPSVEEQLPLERPVWPEPPAQPRLEFLTSFTGPDDFGIEKSFLQWIGVFISGVRWQHIITPMAITVTPEGVVYVADPGANGIHRFDKKNNDYRLIFRTGGLAFLSPVGLASDLDGAVYIMDSRLGALFVIEPDATEAELIQLQGLLDRPTGLALDQHLGNIYIVDTGAHQIKVFSRDGTLLKRIGQRGSGPGEFNYPTMIWRDQQGQLLVSDSMNFRIQIFDAEGQFLREFGEIGNVSGSHSQPKGIASDLYGHIYVVDTLFHTLQIFDPYGTFLLNVGRQGTEPGQFFMPTGIFIGERNTIYIADEYNHRVQVFRYIGPPPP